MSSPEIAFRGAGEPPSAEALGQLLARAVTQFARQVADGGQPAQPFAADEIPSPTDVAVTVCAMLEQVGIEVFELGLWNAWGTGSGSPAREQRRSACQ